MKSKDKFSLFDLIAPVYGWFFSYQVRNYQRVTTENAAFFADCGCQILDIGCGTGALACALAGQGHQVTGLDGSERMIAQARRLNQNNTAQFLVGDAMALPPLSPARFDIVVASYVLHGLQKGQRQELYAVMKGLAIKRVIIMDYNNRRSLLTSLIEWLEHGDYFNFIQLAESEMRQNFPNVRVIQTGKRAAWYICECSRPDSSSHRPADLPGHGPVSL